MAPVVDTTKGPRVEKERVLFEGPYSGAGADIGFDVAPDGRFLMIRSDDASMGRQINVVSNWFAESKQRVPTKFQ